MTSRHDKIGQYRKLLGITETTDLADLKQRYAELNDRFQEQRRSADRTVARKGEKNLQLLDQAYTQLAAAIRQREEAQQIEQSRQTMLIEHACFRVGFRVYESGRFFRLEKVRVSTLGSSRSNAMLSTSWPTGKLSIFDSYLELKCLLGSVQMLFSQIAAIERIWFMPFWLRIRQHDQDAEIAYVFAWGLGHKLKATIQQNRLKLKLDF